MSEEAKLRPCPFCGCAKVESDACGPLAGPCTAWVVCTRCGASGPNCDNSPEAEAAWSRRITQR